MFFLRNGFLLNSRHNACFYMKTSPFYTRIILFIVMYIVVLVMPWWLSVVLLALCTVYMPVYIEVLFFGFVFDTLYASKFVFPYVGLLCSLVFLVAVLLIRTRIRT